ncbi:Malonyl-[acyl-carrier protein] O-methyltransferase [Ferriphaselus amnicola]|uniref:Malonyl-[acyl-carrier protein] O-methyltransferase n=1 Tax=Ferriphaselus amnicola TaxID=1188319 RepID=A0A2Z6G824_9PROT|nr:malonyl-ACP O-methyltransferase BioC [Ferriphaselus amnicola]BBE49616.1 Malonyl-[acyl-carrier protein] O-methyltransferase [Ferriphaselus amnicola]
MNEFEIDKLAVRRAFSRAATQYDAAAVLQREVCGQMLERLDLVKLQPARVLDAGCGTGWGTRQLSLRYPSAQVVALDIAYGMLQAARGDTGWWKKLFGGAKQNHLCADIEALPLAANSVELVWSNLAVQWVNDLPGALAELHRTLKVDGLLMFSTFGPDTLKELRAAFAHVDSHNHVSRFIDMHDIGDMLVGAGFAEPVMDMEMLTLTYEDMRAVMQDLKSIGAHNATAGRSNGLMGKAAWQQVMANYERFRRDGKLPATFEIVYGHAWKVPAKKSADGRAIIQTPFKL